MRDDILTYYERELSYLRRMGAEFATKYPKVASRLNLEADRCEDPHVERLIEGVAFLAARIRHKLDDDLPEITDSLLGILYPHYLAPVPSMAVVQFLLDHEQGKLTTAHDLPRHTLLTTRPVRGTRCRFRTVYPVRLWPLEVREATLESPPTVAPLGGARDFTARTVIRLHLRALPGVKLAELAPDTLRFFLAGESAQANGLYEMLSGGARRVELHGGAKGQARAVVLPPDALQPVGFAADEMALPYPLRSFSGYGLLQEYFAFPSKFLFIDVKGLERARETGAVDELEVRIFCNDPPRFDQTVQASNFRLGCTPIVNLFEKSAEPIWIDHTKEEYRVVSDVHGPTAHEVYAVDSVTSATTDLSQVRTFHPFYGLRHSFDGDGPQTFWHATRRPALDGATEVYLTLLDSSFSASSPAVETLSVRVTCTNRDLPAALPFSGAVGADLDSEDVAPFVRIACLGKPSTPLRPETGRGAHWRLISHLALNYLSIVEQGKEALQGILELYDFADSAVTRRQIAGVADLKSERIVRLVGGSFCRGLRVTMEFDEESYVGSGVYLFAAVLDRFLGLYSSINSFSQLVARTRQREEPLRTWPPRAGEQIVL